MSDISNDPVIEEIIEAARQEIDQLRHTIEKSGSATERLETIQEQIESGIERTRELAESIIAVNEQLQRLATGIQSLQPDELVRHVETTRVAIENEIMPGVAALPGLIQTSVSDMKADLTEQDEEQRKRTSSILQGLTTAAADLKAELTEQAEKYQAQTTTALASTRKMLIAAIALSALALIASVVPLVL